jgi:hypothetical protein
MATNLKYLPYFGGMVSVSGSIVKTISSSGFSSSFFFFSVAFLRCQVSFWLFLPLFWMKISLTAVL